MLLTSGMISGANISCNERMKHGPKGLLKGTVALVAGAATVYMASELKEAAGPLRIPRAHTHDSKRREALTNSFFTLCALAAAGYVTWTFGKSCIESLKIYFDDSEDQHLEVQKVIEEIKEIS